MSTISKEHRKLDFIPGVERVRRPAKLPVVLTRAEARAVLAHLKGDYRLMVHLFYGSGLRLLEARRLRVKDIDFNYNQIAIREGNLYAHYQSCYHAAMTTLPNENVIWKSATGALTLTTHRVRYQIGGGNNMTVISIMLEELASVGLVRSSQIVLLFSRA